MSRWSVTTLGEVATVVAGSTPKTSVDEYWNGEYNWVTPAELNDTTFVINETERKITEKAIKDTSLKPLPIGTVLLSSRAPIGKVSITGVKMYCNQGFKNLVCSEKLFNKYLFWFLKGKTEFLNSLGRGATFKEVSKTIVEKIIIPLPPFETQKQIAKTLDTAADLLAMRKQQLAELDNLIKATFYDMFGDPVRNEKGWTLKKLPQLVAKSKNSLKRGPFGGALKKEIFVNEGYLVYEQNHALNNDYSFKRYFIDQKTFNELKDFEVKAGDILISCSGVYLGKLSIVPKDALSGIINQALLKVTLNNNEMNQVFFVYVFSNPTFKNKYITSNRGSGIPNLPPMPVMKNIDFITPPIFLQNQFAEIVAKIEEQKALVQKAIDETQYLFYSLMERHFE